MNWPGVTHPLVDLYGPAAVFAAGLAVLGYPSTWITSVAEVVKIHEYLAREAEQRARGK